MDAEAPYASSPAWARLQDQIAWYDRKSQAAQSRFRLLKICQIVTAAAIPVAAGVSVSRGIIAAAGALIVVLEGLQQLEQYQQNWIGYRSTCEQLKHEQFLFISGAGPYAAISDREALLAERVESLVSQEHAAWTANREDAKGKMEGRS